MKWDRVRALLRACRVAWERLRARMSRARAAPQASLTAVLRLIAEGATPEEAVALVSGEGEADGPWNATATDASRRNSVDAHDVVRQQGAHTKETDSARNRHDTDSTAASHEEHAQDAQMLEAARAVVAGTDPRLAPLLADPRVTDVLVDGLRVRVDRGHGLEDVPDLDLGGCEEVRRLAVRMAAACGRRLDDSSPMVDGTLASGIRLHAVLPPICPDGALISLRVLRPGVFTLESLITSGSVPTRLAPVLRALVTARTNVLVSGSTGAGKTTLLAALLSLVGPEERIICIEEARELRPTHPHVVHLQERGRNVQGEGAVSLTQLVRAALRMRPDRLVLGECRGAEVREVLTALNTGHDGGWATIHANGVEDVPARLVALGALAGMTPQTVAVQAAAAFDAVVHVSRQHGARRVEGIGVFVSEGEGLRCVPALKVTERGEVRPGEAWSLLRARLAEHLPGGDLRVRELRRLATRHKETRGETASASTAASAHDILRASRAVVGVPA